MGSKKINGILILIFVSSLLLRISFILTLDNYIDVWGDWWDELGWKIATGKGYWVSNPYFLDGEPFYSWRSPGFPFFLAIIYKIFGHSFFAAKIGLAILSSLTVVLLYFIGKEIIDEKFGKIASLIYTFYLPSIFWTGYLSPVTLEIFILMFVLFFLIYVEKKQIFYSFFTGIILGYGVLTRGLFFLILPCIILFYWVNNRKEFFKKSNLLILGCFLILLPWIIRNYRIFKKIVIFSTEGGIVCYIANNPKSLSEPSGYWNPPPRFFEKYRGKNEIEINKLLYLEAIDFIRKNPKIYLKLVFDRFKRFWRLYPHTFSGPGESYKFYHQILSFLICTPFILLGFFGMIKGFKNWKNFLIFYLIVLAWSSSIILFFKTVIRYREPIMPIMILFSSYFFKKNVER